MEIKILKRQEIEGSNMSNAILVYFDRGTFVVANGSEPFKSLGEFKEQQNAEIFARAYADAKTFATFDEVLREALTEVKDLLPNVYEAYKQQHAAALKRYKELRPLENTGKADLAQIIVSANVFQRKLNKFIQRNIHFLD